MNKVQVHVQRVRERAVIPQYATEGSAGVDLVACVDAPKRLAPGEQTMIPTGIAIALPSRDLVGLIFPRSGLATRNGLVLANSVGVIDADYRGEIFCPMVNRGKDTVVIEPGDRIAQMLFMPIAVAQLVEAERLETTARGAGGFGSTGS